MKIGLVIADDKEFSPIENECKKQNGKEFDLFGDKALSFKVGNNDIVAVLCGIGKVNAATSTTELIITEKVDCVINFGLSGAIKGVYKDDIVIGTKFLEHDFDLTPMGYEMSVKPQEVSHFEPDKDLYNKFVSAFDFLKPCVFVTGDMFVSSKSLKDFIIDKFNGGCCDMESAAIASVCYKFKVPFLSYRLLSDDADESAPDTYHGVNNLEDDTLFKMVLNVIG